MKRLLFVAILVAGLMLMNVGVALAGDGWDGSGGTFPTWTKSRTVPVHLVGHFDPVVDGGAPIGTSGWWIDYIDYDTSAEAPWAPDWVRQKSNPMGQVGSPAGIKVNTSVTVVSGDGKKNVHAVFKVVIVNFFPNALVSPIFSGVTTLDTHRPSTYAPRAASCKRNAYVTLRFRVTDKLSPKARVTILLTKGTRTFKTLSVGTRATGKLLGRRFKCRLAKGTYRFVVKAKDLAGNNATRVGSNALTVN
ncbi:MAG: hypothetical protein IH608_04520 [Proteobacteria bacterium]|nr:hypothetical protein [Pseudomonadota bacterium]